MTIIKNTALAVAGLALSAVPVLAQTPAAPAAAAAPAIQHGQPVPGLCIFVQNRAVGGSQVGRYVVQRLQQLDAPATAELTATKDKLEKDIQAFQASQASLTPEVRQQQGVALNQRAEQFQQVYELRARESEVTSGKALQRVGQEMDPLIIQAYQARACSVLLQGEAVMLASPNSDITNDVIRLLDAKITQFPFDRERLDQARPAAAATPAPATPARAAPRATR